MESDLRSKATHIEDLLGVQPNRYRRPIRGVKGPTTSLHLSPFILFGRFRLSTCMGYF